VNNLEEVAQITGPNGALETLVKAQQQGLTRYLGFSAHSEEVALALLEGFDFDTILFPFNWVCWHQQDLGPAVLRKAREKNTGVLAIKALAKRRVKEGEEKKWPKCWYIPVDNPDEASLALRFTLSKPVTSAVSPSHAELLWWACDAADHLSPLSEEEEALLARLSRGLDPIFPEKS
jgi:predicted aldo/keto reductase-like oxidoreductase